MRPDEVRSLLEGVRKGRVNVDEAAQSLQRSPVADLGFARLDLHRELRQGLPEAIYAEHKTAAQVVAIAAKLLQETSAPVIATRVDLWWGRQARRPCAPATRAGAAVVGMRTPGFVAIVS